MLTNVQRAETYSIFYRAIGTNGQGQALQRVASGGFNVSSGHGNLWGDPVYGNLDTDGDGIADFLEVKCWVNPTTNGNYILAGDLVDASGTHRFSQSAAFAADGSGATMATLIFDLAEIRAAGGLGTYHIENLQLFEVTSSGTAWLDAYQGSSVVIIQGAKAINVGVRTNQFGFTITGTSNLVIVVEACTNLANPIWSPLQTNTLTGDPFFFSDPQWTNYTKRFYRLRYHGSSVVNTPAGNAINAAVRTNQFGFTITGTSNLVVVVEACTNLTNPIWQSLQSCTLTNGSIYFGDPDWTNYPVRFYRIRSP